MTSSIGLSRLHDRDNPELAVALYPLNTDALVRVIAGQLSGDVGRADLQKLQRRVQDALRYDRIDARLFSLLGEISSRLDGPESGGPFFDHAFRLSRTDILALHQMIVRSVERDRKPADAVGYLDILLRRWPERFDRVEPILPALLADQDGYEAILEHLADDPPWRARLVTSLAKEPGSVSAAEKLLFDLSETKSPPRSAEISAAINGYFSQQRYDDAYRLFLFTLTDRERELNGYVFNGSFAPVSSRRPFDWQLREQSGLEVVMPNGKGQPATSGARIRFLDKPVKTISLQQYLHLPSGDYRLSLDASANNLKLPKDLYWSLNCVDPNAGLERLNIPEGSYDHSTLTTDFRVESATCPLQLLRLETGLIAESWRYRYSGTLTMHRLGIERVRP